MRLLDDSGMYIVVAGCDYAHFHIRNVTLIIRDTLTHTHTGTHTQGKVADIPPISIFMDLLHRVLGSRWYGSDSV